jgi:hypothetical protein
MNSGGVWRAGWLDWPVYVAWAVKEKLEIGPAEAGQVLASPRLRRDKSAFAVATARRAGSSQ